MKTSLLKFFTAITGIVLFLIVFTLLFGNPIDAFIDANSNEDKIVNLSEDKGCIKTQKSDNNQQYKRANSEYDLLLDFYDKLLTILIALLAVFSILSYFTIRAVSTSTAEQMAENAVKKHFEGQQFKDFIVKELDSITKLKVEEYSEAVENYYQVIDNIEYFRNKIENKIKEIEKQISKLDSEESTEEVSIEKDITKK